MVLASEGTRSGRTCVQLAKATILQVNVNSLYNIYGTLRRERLVKVILLFYLFVLYTKHNQLDYA